MKLLVCTAYYFYANPRAVEPQYYYLAKVPQTLGHTVDFFDYYAASKIGVGQMRRLFLAMVKGGAYDAVFVATLGDELDEETLLEAQKYSVTFGWNSDDEWRWESYSKHRIQHYRFMVTNSPAVYAANKAQYPNLLQYQWACTGFWDGRNTPKDIDFSFVGQAYGKRIEQINWLKQHAGLLAFGKGTNSISAEPPKNRLKAWVTQQALKRIGSLAVVAEELSLITFEQVNALWNRSKISFTPLDSSDGTTRQIKSRVFDMGLSGTLMLAHRAPYLDTYYEPDKEYVPFETLEECADKARFYLQHESERAKIAAAYARRTESEHLWKHRIHQVLKDAGL
jgi:spore maturation protein CgeB